MNDNNKNEKKKNGNSVIDRVKAAAGKTAVVAGGVMASGAAMAQDGFDAAAITAAINGHTTTATTILGAFILGLWSLRAMGLLRR